MKPYALTPLPMTPPDEPAEPSLEDALPCTCGHMPAWEWLGSTECRLRCDLNHVIGMQARNIPDAIRFWNYAVDDKQQEEGENRKAEGQRQVEEHNEEWMHRAIEGIRALALTHDSFTTEDLRNSNMCRPPNHPNAWGAAFSAAAKRGLIVRAGYAKNRRASAHARIVTVWKGA